MAPKVEPENPKREKAATRQEVLQFEPVTRGRFEKSEPTIVEGQDLDVPTFLRKNIRVK
jgi:cell division protein FtsZ